MKITLKAIIETLICTAGIAVIMYLIEKAGFTASDATYWIIPGCYAVGVLTPIVIGGMKTKEKKAEGVEKC